MRIELVNCTATLLAEIACPEATQKDIAKTYALAMRSSEQTDWLAVNRAIMARWPKGLTRVKTMAHKYAAHSGGKA